MAANVAGNGLQHSGVAGQSSEHQTWEDKLEAASVSKDDLNALVFDYLVVEGFSDAAVEFARETGISSTIDQDMIQERMEIRQAVEDGCVEEAVRRVNELDPEILDTNPPLLFHLFLLRLIELIRADRVEEALQFATLELAPRGAQNPEFLADLERTMALLAFPDLAKDDASSDSSFEAITQLMKRTQRVKVAKELNAAILESQGQGMETKMAGLLRLMKWGEDRLEKNNLRVQDDRGRQWADVVLREV
ncbi:hypothetical protein CcaverHIS002_0302540 [Cutaneotrichosporon cavernicola]|uniref:CTLH domain-containing protein n=1 Tax=Cutaneotrichosporon cavernicola TaxID=279322 RepID=A0AA48IIW4_9TREE|nr:uncharacterized protein CcaverHIS019_0302530 [Cutaneotrichosporon cavernicola]BEI82386.1 hypothetical protein CcaverHIS002_0302540 [Cutaneotrichosporon cavernicola]BEI90183.1 hypothetical protein CcaverHIS019_0302530 [Cutaneotrichosporon cavernicola]BEI97962.1 hypothetical protein CcaverHIS631_0302610 [Cutaneotrichosporon cavernicola]BEJ05738.1 hypothetical protein CcaverHIS641_0302600 [Cutaneotrichosporon cavernicola]